MRLRMLAGANLPAWSAVKALATSAKAVIGWPVYQGNILARARCRSMKFFRPGA